MKLLSKAEKASAIESFDLVRDAKDDGTANQFTKGGWRKFYMGRYEYARLGNGVLFKFSKPGIDSTIWYDDETPDPFGKDDENKKACFMSYNLRHNFNDFGLAKWRKAKADLEDHGCCSGAYLEAPYVAYREGDPTTATAVFFITDYERKSMQLDGWSEYAFTEGEFADFCAIIDECRARFEKRLETYFKRYADKIWSCGYWANR